MILVYALVLAYCVFTLALQYYWRRLPQLHFSPRLSQFPTVSVIIAARNEARCLPTLLECLRKQDYPHDQFEIILVNDYSSDETAALARQAMAAGDMPHLTVLDLPEGLAGKKAALAYGIAHSRGAIIATTDADCVLTPQWVSHYAAVFNNPEVQFAFGMVTFADRRNLFTRMQIIEFASLTGSGAALLEAGLPSLCNGANLAYRRSLFEAVGGFAGSGNASGDDTSLLMKAAEKFGTESIVFVKNRQSIVSTYAQAGPLGFLRQRLRWASKWRSYGSWKVSAVAVFIFLANAAWLAIMIEALLENDWLFAFPMLFVRLLAEAWFLESILRFQGKPLRPIAYLVTYLVYPFYVVFFGLLANLFRTYHWKGRQLK